MKLTFFEVMINYLACTLDLHIEVYNGKTNQAVMSKTPNPFSIWDFNQLS